MEEKAHVQPVLPEAGELLIRLPQAVLDKLDQLAPRADLSPEALAALGLLSQLDRLSAVWMLASIEGPAPAVPPAAEAGDHMTLILEVRVLAEIAILAGMAGRSPAELAAHGVSESLPWTEDYVQRCADTPKRPPRRRKVGCPKGGRPCATPACNTNANPDD